MYNMAPGVRFISRGKEKVSLQTKAGTWYQHSMTRASHVLMSPRVQDLDRTQKNFASVVRKYNQLAAQGTAQTTAASVYMSAGQRRSLGAKLDRSTLTVHWNRLHTARQEEFPN